VQNNVCKIIFLSMIKSAVLFRPYIWSDDETLDQLQGGKGARQPKHHRL
jgi:hypothetical protein